MGSLSKLLYEKGFYNQSVYFYIQSMEKYIKSAICKKVDITNTYYANRLRNLGHSLDTAIDFFIEIISENDEILKLQIIEQLKNSVLKGLHFSTIYNSTRYPTYKNESYRIVEMSQNDCEQLMEIYASLKRYISALNVRI